MSVDTSFNKERDFTENAESGDIEFKNAVQNTLDIIKDFYGANSSAVFWYNNDTKKFKLLTASSGGDDSYVDRFEAGDDSISKLCRDKKSALINLSKETGPENSGLSLYKNPTKIRSLIACPVIINDSIIAVVICDSKAESFFGAPNLETLYVFSESLAYYMKYFILEEELSSLKSETLAIRRRLLELEKQNSQTINLVDPESKLYNVDFFNKRLASEVNKNKVFSDRNIYCICCGIDNLENFQEIGFEPRAVEMILISLLKEQLNGYDMIFKLSDNKYAIITSFGSEEKAFLEFEKIRKNISSRIHDIEGKDVNFTVTFVIKRIQDTEITGEELVKVLELSSKESGNLVKLV